MAEATQIIFSHKEVVTALIKQQKIHNGIWMLAINFGFGASNVGQTPDGTDLNPAAIVPVIGIGLQKAAELNNMSVDAAVVNPA